jgi:hypothetical protein
MKKKKRIKALEARVNLLEAAQTAPVVEPAPEA